jgi:hypothetical protein
MGRPEILVYCSVAIPINPRLMGITSWQDRCTIFPASLIVDRELRVDRHPQQTTRNHPTKEGKGMFKIAGKLLKPCEKSRLNFEHREEEVPRCIRKAACTGMRTSYPQKLWKRIRSENAWRHSGCATRLRGRRSDCCNAKSHAVWRLRTSEYLRGPLPSRRSEIFSHEPGCKPAQRDSVNASCQHESLFLFVALVRERTVIAGSAPVHHLGEKYCRPTSP